MLLTYPIFADKELKILIFGYPKFDTFETAHMTVKDWVPGACD